MTMCLPAEIAARACRMPTAGLPVAPRYVHRAARNSPHAVVGEGGGRDPRLVPADRAARLAGAIAVEIDDDRHFQSRRVRHLRQEHRAEFAGADQRDADRFAGFAAGVEEVGEVHGTIDGGCWRAPRTFRHGGFCPGITSCAVE
jgi:hypothetical protein